MTGVDDDRQLRGFDHFVERIDRRIVGKERLRLRVQFEAADLARGDQPFGLANPRRAARRIDADERDDDIVVTFGKREHVVVADVGPRLILSVDGEHDARHAPLAIVRRHVVERLRWLDVAEVFRRLHQHRIFVGRAGRPRVDVNVDRIDLIEG